MAAATGLPQVSRARNALFSAKPASKAAFRPSSPGLPPPRPPLPPSSPRSAPAQKPLALPEVITAPLMAASDLMVSTTSPISLMTEAVRVFIERPGTSKVTRATPSESTSILKFSMVLAPRP